MLGETLKWTGDDNLQTAMVESDEVVAMDFDEAVAAPWAGGWPLTAAW